MQPKPTWSSQAKGKAKAINRATTTEDQNIAARMQESVEAMDKALNEPTAPLVDPEPQLLLTEKEQAASTRRKPEIDPSSSEFYNVFNWLTTRSEEELISVQDVLDEHFTPHEHSLLTPANPRTDRALSQIQRLNRVRYFALMETERFKEWRDEAGNLVFKLTMLWFGLPVAPVDDLPADSEDEGWEETVGEEDGLEAVGQYKHDKSYQPVGEPLRFLNSYGVRYFGDDSLRAEDPTYRAYYAFNDLYAVHHKHEVPRDISLRGGGLDDGLNDDMSESVDDDYIQSQLRLEGVEEVVNQFAADDDLGDLDIDMDQLFEVTAPGGVSFRGGAGPGHPSRSLGSPTDNDLPRPKTSRGYTGQRPRVHFEEDMAPPSPRRMISWARTPLKPGTKEPTSLGLSPTPSVDPDMIDLPPPQQDIPSTQEKNPRRDQSMREKSYAHPMSVWTENKIPVNAPALEKVLRFGSDSIPTMSLGVMTPTEQRRLQIAYYNMRNIALERSVQCPYAGCKRVFAMAEENRLQKHLEDVHVGDQCNFCDSVLWKCWSDNERRAHFLSEHRNLFLTEAQWKADNSFNVPSLFRVDWERESRYLFCPRCGRDHNALNARADRTHHDNVCYPGSEESQYEWTACEDCGGRKVTNTEHECQTVINPDEPPYCRKCALPAGLFSDLYRATHHLHCHGRNNEVAQFCPWCGQSCGRDMVEDALKHMTNCVERPDNQAQGPLNPDTAAPWPFLLMYNPKREGPGIHKDPPTSCTECKQAVFHMDAHLLMKHIEDNHEDKLDHCIFCKLDYKSRGWLNNRRAKVQHLDDHIHERKQTLATELVQSRLWPAGHPYTKRRVEAKDLEKLQTLRELQHKDERLANLRESNHALVTEMNEDKASIEMLRSQLRLHMKEARRQSRHDMHEDPQPLDTPPASSAVKQKPKEKEKEKEMKTGTPAAKDKKGKGKEKEALITESASKTKATSTIDRPKTPVATAPPTSSPANPKKRKNTDRDSASHDPSYRPGSSDESDDDISDEDPESPAAEPSPADSSSRPGPSNPKKRKHNTHVPGPNDPSYRLRKDDDEDSAEEDPEFIKAEKILRATVKRQKTGKKDPSFTAKDVADVEPGDTERVKAAPISSKKRPVSSSKHD